MGFPWSWPLAAAMLSAALLTGPARVSAQEPWMLNLEASAGLPVMAPQDDLFGPGGAISVGIYRPLGGYVLLGLKLQGGLFLDGDTPADPGRVDPANGGFGALMLAGRLRPLASGDEGRRGTGPFIELAAGPLLTGELLRPAGGVAIGWGIAAGDIVIGPVARYMQIIQPEDAIDDRDAHLALLGVELTLFDALPVEPEPEGPGDRDGDGIVDPEDACPDDPEDHDGFQDEDGCPDPDNDGDGILDGDDRCPNDPEDRDGFEDEDGCPDPDNDGDGILDGDDQCPNEPETVNGNEDEDGCPDEGLIELVNDRIVLEERVLFDFERARVKTAARPILDALVNLWRQHPEWTQLRIEGHADVRGDPDYNRTLSQRRAQNVMAELVRRGVPQSIIDAIGHGDSQPRDPGTTEEAHQRNRRVEFVVMARHGVPTGGAAGGGTVVPIGQSTPTGAGDTATDDGTDDSMDEGEASQ